MLELKCFMLAHWRITSLLEYMYMCFTVCYSDPSVVFLACLLPNKQSACYLRSKFNVVQRKTRAVPRSSAHERDTRSCKGRLYTCDCQWRLFDGENFRRHWRMSTGDRLFFCDAGESSSVESVSFQVKLPYQLIPSRLNVNIVVEVGLLF